MNHKLRTGHENIIKIGQRTPLPLADFRVRVLQLYIEHIFFVTIAYEISFLKPPKGKSKYGPISLSKILISYCLAY